MASRWSLAAGRWWLLAACGLALGIAIARLPLPSLALAAGAAMAIAVVAIALAEPVLGLAIALIAAPFAPLENIMLRLPVDSGQALLALALGAWGLRTLHDARWSVRAVARPAGQPMRAAPAALAIFIAVALLSFFAARSFELWAKESLKWIEVLAAYGLVVAARDRRKAAWLIGALLISAAFQGAFGMYQFALRGEGPDEFAILREGVYRAYGTFEQPNPYGGYLGLLWPFAVGMALCFARQAVSAARGATRPAGSVILRFVVLALLSGLAGALALAGLAASWSRGAWLGAAAAAAAMLIVLPRRMGVSLAVLGVGGLAFAALLGAGLLPASIEARLTDFTSQFSSFDVRGVQVSESNYAVIERLAHWQAAQNMILDQPAFGVGFGNYAAAYDQYRALNWPIALGHAHNTYLNVWAETGAVGFAAYLGMWATIVLVTLRAARGGVRGQKSDVRGRKTEVGSQRSQVDFRLLTSDVRLPISDFRPLTSDLRPLTSDFRVCLAIGLLGAWAHLAVHSLFDSLYVANIYLLIGVFLGLLDTASRSTLRQSPISNLQSPVCVL